MGKRNSGMMMWKRRMERNYRFGRLAVLVCCMTFLFRPQSAQASWLGDYWSRFDRFLATFDPAGRYVRQPVEKTIPALTFKGFYRQWTDVMLGGGSHKR